METPFISPVESALNLYWPVPFTNLMTSPLAKYKLKSSMSDAYSVDIPDESTRYLKLKFAVTSSPSYTMLLSAVTFNTSQLLI